MPRLQLSLRADGESGVEVSVDLPVAMNLSPFLMQLLDGCDDQEELDEQPLVVDGASEITLRHLQEYFLLFIPRLDESDGSTDVEGGSALTTPSSGQVFDAGSYGQVFDAASVPESRISRFIAEVVLSGRGMAQQHALFDLLLVADFLQLQHLCKHIGKFVAEQLACATEHDVYRWAKMTSNEISVISGMGPQQDESGPCRISATPAVEDLWSNERWCLARTQASRLYTLPMNEGCDSA